jgi:CRP/FNR family transcriptional regulator, anaerobic regulatory protein
MRPTLTEARFPFLARLSVGGRRQFAALVAKRVASRRSVLRRGDSADGAYLVVGGALRVYYVSAAGREATLYHVEAGGTCVLALTATFAGEPYPAWVQGGPSGAEVVRVPSALFRRLFDEEAAFREFVLRALSARIFELMCTLEETGSVMVERRVARYLIRGREPDGYVRASQIGIASELGTAREVVYRALRALSDRRLIQTARMRIRILDDQGLADAAQDDAAGSE